MTGAWKLEADGHVVASGTGISVTAEPGKATRYVVSGLVTHVTPRRECAARLSIDGEIAASGRVRVERWGSALLVNALSREFTVEVGR